MASTEERRSPKTGAVMSYRVTWREDGRKQSETLGKRADALHFQALVERAGNRWPESWVKGGGFPSMLIPERERVALADDSTAAPTFGEALAAHLADPDNHRMQPGTVRTIRAMMERHCGPIWPARMDALRTAELQAFLDALGESLAKATVTLVRTYMRATFDSYIHHHGLTMANPMGRTKTRGKAPKAKATALTRAEFDALLAALTMESDRTYVLLMAFTGLRPGEAYALRVSDLDLDALIPAVRVTKTVKRHAEKGYTIGSTKTDRSTRAVVLPADIVPILREHVYGMATDAKLFKGKSSPHFTERWRKAIKAAGLPFVPRPYDLRHSHATWLLESGVDMATISARLGHANIGTTSRYYIHVARTDLDAKAANSLNHKPQVDSNTHG